MKQCHLCNWLGKRPCKRWYQNKAHNLPKQFTFRRSIRRLYVPMRSFSLRVLWWAFQLCPVERYTFTRFSWVILLCLLPSYTYFRGLLKVKGPFRGRLFFRPKWIRLIWVFTLLRWVASFWVRRRAKLRKYWRPLWSTRTVNRQLWRHRKPFTFRSQAFAWSSWA